MPVAEGPATVPSALDLTLTPAAMRGASASAGASCGGGLLLVEAKTRSGWRGAGYVLVGLDPKPWLTQLASDLICGTFGVSGLGEGRRR